MSREPPGEGPGQPGERDRAVASVPISIDDIYDAEFDLADVITPHGPTEQAEPPMLAIGSESRRRVIIDQNEPSPLDLQLIAYLLDIEPPDGSSSGD